MQRKLVKQGNNALTVTLPHEWIKAKGLQVGNYVEIIAKPSSIEIFADKKEHTTHISFDVSNLEKSAIWHMLQSAYIKGFDEITVHHIPKNLAQQINELAFTGFVLEYQTEKRTTLRSIIKTPQDSLSAILKRIYFMFHELTDKLIELQNKKIPFAEFEQYCRFLDKNILFCMRYLSKYEQLEKNYRIFLLLATLEEAADIIKLYAKHVNEKDDLKKLTINVHTYIHAMIKGDYESVYELLQTEKEKIPTKTFTDGLIRSFYECLYNFSGYLIE